MKKSIVVLLSATLLSTAGPAMTFAGANLRMDATEQGDLVWKKAFGGGDEDVFHSVTAGSDGCIAVGFSGARSFGTGDWPE